jgi:hypothetical protein
VSESSEALSAHDKLQRLSELERAIAQNTFVDRGIALAEINQNELYKPAFSSFEDYCVNRWGFKRAHGYASASL